MCFEFFYLWKCIFWNLSFPSNPQTSICPHRIMIAELWLFCSISFSFSYRLFCVFCSISVGVLLGHVSAGYLQGDQSCSRVKVTDLSSMLPSDTAHPPRLQKKFVNVYDVWSALLLVWGIFIFLKILHLEENFRIISFRILVRILVSLRIPGSRGASVAKLIKRLP